MNMPETFFTVSEELRLFGMSCIMGAALGPVFDVFRAFRLILRHNDALTAIEDVLFFMLYAAALIVFSQLAARSEMRLYFAVGNVLGFAVYHFTVGSVVLRTISKLIGMIRAVFRLFFIPLRRFFAPLCAKVGVKFVGIYRIIVKTFKKTRIVLRNRQHLLYNKMENNKRKNVKSVVEKNET